MTQESEHRGLRDARFGHFGRCRMPEIMQPASTFARLRSASHALLISVSGRVGSLGVGLPKGNRYSSGLTGPKRHLNHCAWSERAPNSSEFMGICRPVPDEVFAFPT